MLEGYGTSKDNGYSYPALIGPVMPSNVFMKWYLCFNPGRMVKAGLGIDCVIIPLDIK